MTIHLGFSSAGCEGWTGSSSIRPQPCFPMCPRSMLKAPAGARLLPVIKDAEECPLHCLWEGSSHSQGFAEHPLEIKRAACLRSLSPAQHCPVPASWIHQPLSCSCCWRAKSSPGDVKGCDIWEQTQPVSPKPLPAPHTPRHNTSCLMCSTCIPKSLTSHRKQGWKGAQQSPNPSLKQSWHNYKVSLETPRSITGCTWEALHSSLMLQGTWQLCENTQHPQAKQELKEKHCLF